MVKTGIVKTQISFACKFSIHALRMPGLPRRRRPREWHNAAWKTRIKGRDSVCRQHCAAPIVCPARKGSNRSATLQLVMALRNQHPTAADGVQFLPSLSAGDSLRREFVNPIGRSCGKRLPEARAGGSTKIACTRPVLCFKSCMPPSTQFLAAKSFLCNAQSDHAMLCNFALGCIPCRGHPTA